MGHSAALARALARSLTRAILGHRIRALHPTLISDPTAIWDYGYRDIHSIRIGQKVSVGPYAEIVIYRTSPYSSVEGSLTLEDGSVIGAGANIRAAGGAIRIGAGSAVTQNCVVVAANHKVIAGVARLHNPWDEERCGIDIGANVWIGANSVVLPGASIGDNAIIAAGSVVRGVVPPGELWGGVPARRIRDLGEGAAASADAPA
ncbi:MAG: acyltransferase [Phenylobacterium sp.]|nr:acyltransferase [Phenylobacterium sp.]